MPGHGPLATPAAVADLKGYFEFLTTETRLRFDGGMSPMEAARDIDLGPYSGWSEPERVVANVHALYRDFGSQVPGDALTLMAEMADLAEIAPETQAGTGTSPRPRRTRSAPSLQQDYGTPARGRQPGWRRARPPR